MTSVQRRIAVVCAAIASVTLAVQWSGLSSVLDKAVGIHWSAGLVEFLKANTQGMVILVLLAVFLEFVGLDHPRERDRQEREALADLLTKTLKTSSGLALTQHYLMEQYGERAAEQLGHLVSRHSPELKEFVVRIEVKRTTTGAFDVIITNTYETNIPKYIIALTDNPLHTEALLATGVLAEVFTIQKPAEESWTPDDLPVTVDRISRSKGTTEVLSHLVFHKLTTKQKAALLGKKRTDQTLNRLHLFEGLVQGDRGPRADAVEQYRVVYRTIQNAEYPYTFWSSDRVLHLRSIEIDLSDLDRQVYENSRIHFFLGTIRWSADVKQANGVWSFPVDSWLVSGQGLMVLWPQNSPNVSGRHNGGGIA